ncbi:MAG: hypothetical protein VYE73_11105 [Acidobacteriota bacterium]|nr:hypothetical protein [Acidobacteriota bacterium]
MTIHDRTTRLAAVAAASIFLAAATTAYEPPRRADGRPDLGGVWTNSSLTRLSRPGSVDKLVLTPEKAQQMAAGHFHNVRAAKEFEKSDPNRGAPDKVKSLPPVGNYNASWVDPGSTYGVVNGEIRSSWLIEPADGKVPYQPIVREQGKARRTHRSGIAGPEVLSLGERCLIGFGGTAGPPMLNVLYNNHYEIVQTDDRIMILVEMVHDARVVRMDADHGAAADLRWLGDSVGRWDGDTLVVETTHFHPARSTNGPLYYSANAMVTERFTRVSDSQIHYEFIVDDPEFYTAEMRGEMSFNAVDKRVYEYACHEGNYAMGNMLRGARLLESEASSGR